MRITTISLFLAIMIGLALGASSLMRGGSSPLDDISAVIAGREAQAPATPAAQAPEAGDTSGNPMELPSGVFVGPTGPPTIKGPPGPPPRE